MTESERKLLLAIGRLLVERMTSQSGGWMLVRSPSVIAVEDAIRRVERDHVT